MLDVEINEENSSIRLKQNYSTIVAEGRFAIDSPDHMVLVRIIDTIIETDDVEQIGNLISTVHDYFGKTYNARVVVRFPPAFDNKIDTNNPKLKNSVSTFMAVNAYDLKYDNDDFIQYDREQYALITDKQAIVVYAKQIMILMTTEAFWAKDWDEEEAYNRILSATAVIMIMDKINKVPVGFGRMFMMRYNNNNKEETFGYLSDVAVNIQHQSKGLGRVIVNYFVSVYIAQDISQRSTNGSLSLICGNKGSGAISAPRLYQRLGFQHLDNIGNRIAIFPSEKYYFRRSLQSN